MSTIYSSAQCVRIWLGLANALTESTFHAIDMFYDSGQAVTQFGLELTALCARPYWSRLWIIQEFILAAEIYIHCGSVQMKWHAFAWALSANPDAIEEIHDSTAFKLCAQRRNWRRMGRSATHVLSTETSLLSFVEIHRDAQCADVRDKIYGLRGLAPRCCQVAIHVDYSESAYHMFQRVLEHDFSYHPRSHRQIMQRGVRLCRTLVEGAMRQNDHAQLTFPVGKPGSQTSTLSKKNCLTAIGTHLIGIVRWVLPSLSESWAELPVEQPLLWILTRMLQQEYGVERPAGNEDVAQAPQGYVFTHSDAWSEQTRNTRNRSQLGIIDDWRKSLLRKRSTISMTQNDVVIFVEPPPRVAQHHFFYATPDVTCGNELLIVASNVLGVVERREKDLEFPLVVCRAMPIKKDDLFEGHHNIAFIFAEIDFETIMRLSHVCD
jgi:hypothetical protein